jgi:putative membrane protein
MSRKLLTDQARAHVTEVVKAIEAQTSAEVVLSVRKSSGDYRHIDCLFGFGAAVLMLIGLLFADFDYDEWTTIGLIVVIFALGAGASAYSLWLRRLFSSRKLRRENVLRSARAAFVELGVSRTDHRIGVLVYVSLLERAVELVPDAGVDVKAIGDAWEQARANLETTLRRGGDLDRFAEAMRALAQPLAKILPHTGEERNQLPDEPQAA